MRLALFSFHSSSQSPGKKTSVCVGVCERLSVCECVEVGERVGEV